MIKNGSFYGRGVIFSSETLNSIINIDGGNFDSINLLASSSNLSSGVISGGNISNLILSGYSNELTTTGGAIDKLSLSGEGENTLNLGAGNTLSSIESTSGTSIVNSWNDSHFTDTTINAGSIIFNNQDFSLDSGSSFNLLTPDASAYFNGSRVNIQSNALYDAGYGLTTAQVFNVESGASIRSVLSSDGDGGYDLPNNNISELIISSMQLGLFTVTELIRISQVFLRQTDSFWRKQLMVYLTQSQRQMWSCLVKDGISIGCMEYLNFTLKNK